MHEKIKLIDKFLIDALGLLSYKETDEWKAWQNLKSIFNQQTNNKQDAVCPHAKCKWCINNKCVVIPIGGCNYISRHVKDNNVPFYPHD